MFYVKFKSDREKSSHLNTRMRFTENKRIEIILIEVRPSWALKRLRFEMTGPEIRRFAIGIRVIDGI